MENQDSGTEKDVPSGDGFVHDKVKAEHMAHAEDPHRAAELQFMKLAIKAADNLESGDTSTVQNSDEHDGVVHGWQDNLVVALSNDGANPKQQVYGSEHRDALITLTEGHNKVQEDQRHSPTYGAGRIVRSVELSHEEIVNEAIRLRDKARESANQAAENAANKYDQERADQKAKSDDIRRRLAS